MMTDTRFNSLEIALKLRAPGSSIDADSLVKQATVIENWLDGENPAEIRFDEVRSDLSELRQRIHSNEIDAIYRGRPDTGWFVAIIVALALLAIGYLVFSANSGPNTPATLATPAAQVQP